jgi:putative CocE/NonD family hydrolase
LTRTPYNAAGRAKRKDSTSIGSTLPLADEDFVKAGYIRVYQDIRGKYGSEGEYVVTRPVIGPLNATKVDHTTDAYDTIDWLVNKANLPQSNGKVGMIGSSYEGFTVVMALLGPHPALKVAAPESPMVDGWMGDDWFHLRRLPPRKTSAGSASRLATRAQARAPKAVLRRLREFSRGSAPMNGPKPPVSTSFPPGADGPACGL